MTRKPIDRERMRAFISPPPDPRDPNNDIIERCRDTTHHDPHRWLRPVGEETVHYFICPGVR